MQFTLARTQDVHGRVHCSVKTGFEVHNTKKTTQSVLGY